MCAVPDWGKFGIGPIISGISSTPTSHDFGSILIGSTSPPQTFTISNNGDADLDIGTIILTDTDLNDFVILFDSCSGFIFAPLDTCTIDVLFSPTSSGAKSANLSIPSNDSVTPILNVPLSGTGIDPDDVDDDGDGYTENQGDCDDGDPAINPGATEVCDGLDNDCDSGIDEGVQTTYYEDADGDGYGNPSVSTTACTQPAGNVTDNTDCDDGDATVYPGATEVCDGNDTDCNNMVDDVLITYYVDGDSDGYGDPAFPTDLIACITPTGYSNDSDDCNDSCAECFPGNPEVCDEKDNNCDGQVDEGVTNTYYLDSDADGYGDPDNTTQACSMPNGYVDGNSDCDDNDSNVNPSAIEILGNGIDDNCDGFQPTEATEDLIVDIEELNLEEGIENSLTSKLNNAIKSLEKGQANAAVNQLNAFINNIEALRGKELTDDEVDELIGATQEIISSINSA